jgi:hypothetical protein
MELDSTGHYYINPHRDSLAALPDSFPQSLLPEIRAFLSQALTLLEDGLRTHTKDDLSLYTGSVGVALTLARLKSAIQHTSRRDYPQVEHSESGLEWKGIGPGSSGLCFELYRCLTTGEPFELDEAKYRDPHQSDEALDGRCGLLVMLDYFTRKGMVTKDPDIQRKVVSAIDLNAFPWTWKGDVQYGGAHGSAGILFTLKRLAGIERVDLAEALIDEAAVSSGNFKKARSSSEEDIVQWCHGAPGFVPFLLEYAPQSQLAASKTGPAVGIIWERGLLAKGASVCHGMAGNGYCLLDAYLFSGIQQHLMQACCFATEIFRLGPVHCCAKAEHPLSLFEGLAGVVQFMLDLSDIVALAQSNPDRSELARCALFDGFTIF